MKNAVSRYWFFAALLLLIVIAFRFPAVGIKVREWNLLKIGIFLAFLITGLKLDTRRILDEARNFRGLAASQISTFALFPLLALFLAKSVFRSNADFVIGTCINAVSPVTIASGTILTAIAAGNVPLSLLICVSSNLIAVFTIPFSLELLVRAGGSIDLPIGKMIAELFSVLVIPTVLGQLLRMKVKDSLRPYDQAFSVFSQMIVLLIIFNAVAGSTAKIAQAGLTLISVFVLMFILHALVLLLNFGISRLLRLNLASTAAFTIHTSQKTLTVSFLVWAGYFAAAYPMAMIPAIVYHLIQVVTDTFVAHRFRFLAGRS